MKKRLLPALLLVVASAASTHIMAQGSDNGGGATPAPPVPPAAARTPKVTTIHGETLTDNYFYLREKSKKEVIDYLNAENAYTDAVMKPTVEFQDKLYKEILSRIKQTDTQVPYRDNGYYYYTRTVEGKQYPIFARKKGSLTAPEEITLDVNAMAEGHKFYSIGNYSVSADGNLLAYSVDTNGYREYNLYIKDLRTGKNLPDDLGDVDYAFFLPDNKTLFYVTHDHPAKRSYRVWRHTLGEPKEKDVLVFEEKDEVRRASARLTRSKKYVIIGSTSSDNTEYRYLPADRPATEPKLLLARQGTHEYYPEHHGKVFLIRTNDRGRGFRLVSAPTEDPRPENWKEIVPARKGVTLEGLTVFKDFYVLSERDQGVQKQRVVDLRSGKEHYVEHPEPVYSVGGQFAEFDSSVARYGYQSFTTPFSVYDYDMRTRKKTLLKQTEVLGGYDSSKYAAERIVATAPDGVKVPISLYYRKDLRKSGPQPLWLYGYGSYGNPSNVGFNSNRLSMIDRGFIYAIAHIRGGGDLGREWHDEGKVMKKKNTFIDFVAAADHLVNAKYTSKDNLVISGGSAGGLLMGAVTNMRPDLFKVVVSYVPFVDVINTMLDASLPLTVPEYLEWGNPNNKEAYAYMKSYSPYDNIEAKAYPTMLVRASLNDSQVPYWEAAKYVAKLRELKTDKNLLLFKINMGAGHGGASGRYDALRDTAFDYAFVLSQFGITN